MSEQSPPVEEPSNDRVDMMDEQAQDRPSYDSYQKVLSEKKKERERAKRLESELRELQTRIKSEEEKRLAEQNQYKELYGKTREELEAREKQLAAMRQEQDNARKMHSFLNAIKADIPRQYWDLVDLDQIAVDGDTIDEYSVQKYVETFRTTFPDIVRPKEARRLPIDSPDPHSDGVLTYEKWLTLPPKEQKQRYQEMRRNDRARQ